MPPHSNITSWPRCNSVLELESCTSSLSSRGRQSCDSHTSLHGLLVSEKNKVYPKRTVKTVSFSPLTKVCHVESARSDYSPEEIEACWYSAEELHGIRTCNRDLLSQARSMSNYSVDEAQALRGLEIYMHPVFSLSRKIKKAGLAAVLQEQENQQRAGAKAGVEITDPEMIRDCYLCVTSRLRQRAANLAQHDAAEAQNAYQETDRMDANVSKGWLLPQKRPCWALDRSFWFPRGAPFIH